MAIEQKRKSGEINGKFAGSKKPISAAESRPNKRPRQDDQTNTQPEKKSRPIIPTSIAKLSNEDAAFPRGGASVLTPLEHKQIAIEATKDVLFEQAGAKAAEDGKAPVYTKNKRTGNRRKTAPVVTEEKKDEIVIEGINYKRLFPGSLLLGQVAEVNANDIAIALPNNLTGYCPITSISTKLTEKIEQLATVEADDEDDSYLQALPKVGQYLRCYVVSTSDEKDSKNEKAKRRIELSIMPQQANAGLTKTEVVANNFIQASVLSVEDHGLIMDIGLSEDDAKGFMGAKDIGQNISSVVEGTVFLCAILGLSSNGKTVKLSADISKLAASKKAPVLSNAPTIDSYLPGVITEALITETTSKGIIGKIDGSLDITADLMHSGAGADDKDMDKKYKIGSKIRCRIICTFPKSEPRKIGVSLLPHIIALESQKTAMKEDPLSILPLSKVIKVTVKKVEPGIGLFVDLGVKGAKGFVHISRVQDGKIETLSETSGAFKLGTEHEGRIIGYNRMDGVFLLSLEEKILAQRFLRIEDVRVGEVIKNAKIEKLIVNSSGVGGVLVNLSEGISGLVPEIHLADVKLAHPERVFKEGANVTCRVLSTDPSKRQIRLTLKKSLVNSDAPAWSTYTDMTPGASAPGTIVNIVKSGAVIQFFGDVRGFLPVSEMSEAFIADPSEHFRTGQVLTLYVKDVDVDAERLTVSCKDPASFGMAQQDAYRKLKLGELVSGTVLAQSADDITVELTGGLRAVLALGHLTDNSEAKNASAFKKIRVSQTMTELVVLDERDDGHVVSLSNKPSLRAAATSRMLLRGFEDVKEGKVVAGFVKNINQSVGVFVQFAGGLTGLVGRREVPVAAQSLPDFGLRPFQSVSTKITSVDQDQQRFYLSIRQAESDAKPLEPATTSTSIGSDLVAMNPIDESIKTVGDITIGKITRAKIASIKDTQINVQLADNIQGRVDVSSVFDDWKDIADRKTPLASFHKNQVISVRVLGIHDARNHRFLPISHRGSKNVVYELSAKPSVQAETAKVKPLTLDKVQKGASYIAYVNNIGDGFLFVNLSPNVRGRIQVLEVSDDVSLLSDLETNFPIGSAIRVVATHIDVPNNRLDLSARSTKSSETISADSLSKNQVLPAKVIKVSERQIVVQLSDNISAPIHLPDLADDFSEANPMQYKKNDVIRVCITDIQGAQGSKRFKLSTRPSRVLNSSLPVKDKEIKSTSDLAVKDVVRGFIKAVSPKGIFIDLGSGWTGYVTVSDLSDQYLKEWENEFQVGQLVKGKVTSIDHLQNQIQLSLKESVLDKNYVPPITFNDLKVGDTITGSVRKVEDFGVFIVIDNSRNVSGLCHKTEIADAKVEDVKKLYSEGDLVKAVVLKLDPKTKRVSFGLKLSYLEGGVAEESDSDEEVEGDNGAELEIEDEDSEDEDVMDVDAPPAAEDEDEDDNSEAEEESDADKVMSDAVDENDNGVPLSTGGFDWTGNLDQNIESEPDSDANASSKKSTKKKKSKPTIKVDRTGDLDLNGPQTTTDFERLILGQPDSSTLWIAYAAHYAQLSELPRARDVLTRALSTISQREETEKFNIWIALLSLENSFGTNETLQDAFTRACQYNDAQEVHERLSNIYISSGKNREADELLEAMCKKFSQSPGVWVNYATFLMTTLNAPERARALLPRATQSLPAHAHLSTTLKFAHLEFRSPNGSPERGRTIFEGVLSLHPKKTNIWGQLLDAEIRVGDGEIIRGVFERVTRIKGLKAKAAKAWFRKWSEWEAKEGDKKSQGKVRAKAEEWVRAAAVKGE